MTSDRKHDLEERLIDFAVAIADVVDVLPDNRTGNHIAGQLIRSGTSAAPNYGESQGAESRKDFIHKMKISLKELKETRVWLKVIARKNYLKNGMLLQTASQECEELMRIFAKSVSTAEKNMLNRKRRKGDIV